MSKYTIHVFNRYEYTFYFIDISEDWRTYYAKVRVVGGDLFISQKCEYEEDLSHGCSPSDYLEETSLSIKEFERMLQGKDNWDLME